MLYYNITTVQADGGVSLAPVSSRNPGGAAAGSLGMHALVRAAMLAGLSPQQSAIDADSAIASAVVAPARNTLMAAWLAANRRYPDEACRRNEDREVTVAHDGRMSAARFSFCCVARREAFHRYLRLPTEMRACQGPFRQNKTSFPASRRSSSSIQQSAKHLPGIQLFPAGAQQVPNNFSLACKFLKRGKKQIKPGRGSA